MEFFLFQSELGIKVIVVLIVWGIRWLYSYLYVSKGCISNEEEATDEIKNKNDPIVTNTPISRKVADKQPQVSPLPQIVATKPHPLTANIIEKDQTTLARKRKLFRHILLADALMQQRGKDFS